MQELGENEGVGEAGESGLGERYGIENVKKAGEFTVHF